MVTTGGVLSKTLTVFVHVEEQELPSVVVKVKVYELLHNDPDVTVTVCIVDEPEMVPLPEIDHA